MKKNILSTLCLLAVAALVSLTAFAGCAGTNNSNNPADADVDGGEIAETSETDETEKEYPSSSFIYEKRTQSFSLADESFEQKFADYFITSDKLPSLDVRALVVIDGTAFAGTAEGVYMKKADDSAFKPSGTQCLVSEAENNAVVGIGTAKYDGKIAVAFKNRIGLIAADGSTCEVMSFQLPSLTSIATTSSRLVIGTSDGVWEWNGKNWDGILAMNSIVNVRSLAVHSDGKVYVAIDDLKVMRIDGAGAAGGMSASAGDFPDDDVRAIASCGDKLIFATKTGAAVHAGTTKTLKTAGIGALPTDDNIALACNATHIIIGHAIGATVTPYDFSTMEHYVSMRWLADNRASAVALGEGSEIYAGGVKGVTRIFRKSRTLAEKEKVFDGYVPYFWRLDGFVAAHGITKTPWDDVSTQTKGDKDNDGLWTQMMIGGWSFGAAATGNAKYCDYARKALQLMFMQIDLPAISFKALGKDKGFIARSIISQDEPDLWKLKVDQAEHVKLGDGTQKDILRWNEVAYNGKKYLWKADTSSDEYAGHFFGYPVYYDLCATAEEKVKIAEYVAVATKYIINGGYQLIDLDGTRTLYGLWDPDSIPIAVDGISACLDNGYDMGRCFSSYGGGGWLNSIEVLGMMLAAYHVTGDTSFYDAYEFLISKRYDEIAMPNENTMTITNSSMANHSDHELAMLAYTTLLRYEPNDDRRAKWRAGLEFLYDYERIERNPWWTAVMALSGGALTERDVKNSLRTLREIPDDNREWLVDNHHRKDGGKITGSRNGGTQLDVVFPYDEIRAVWWNGNMRDVSDGGDGRSRNAPTYWLLPYYMNLYSGLIVEAK